MIFSLHESCKLSKVESVWERFIFQNQTSKKSLPESDFFFSFFSSTKMWLLIDNTSKERVSERFASQAALARFMKLSPQTLNKAVKEGRTVFPFEGRDVQVVKQIFARFEVRDSPRGKVLGRFATQADLAKSIGVSRQAVSAACARICNWDERTVSANGSDFFLFPVFDKSPMTTSGRKIQNPRMNTPDLFMSLPRFSTRFFPALQQQQKS